MTNQLPASGATSPQIAIDFGDVGRDAWRELCDEYRLTLALPPDDMWSTFADQADAAALVLGDELIGGAAVDTDGVLHRFYIRRGFEHLDREVFDELQCTRPIQKLIASTTDPGALSVMLPLGREAIPVAELYTLDAPPVGEQLSSVRPATEADHELVTVVVAAATGGPVEFVGPYLADRIDRRELMLYERNGEILATGERRVDRQSIGYAQLGIVVNLDFRGHGLGEGMMNSLVAMCRDEQLTPLCSTEPANQAAQRLIRQAGFRSRHTIFQMEMQSNAALLDAPGPS